MDRKLLLGKILLAEIGVGRGIQQGDCIVLRKGRFLSLSREISCSLMSGLPTDIEGAVRIDKLKAMLQGLSDDEIELSIMDKVLKLKGKNRKASFAMEEEVLLPVEEVELPGKDEWKPLHAEFSEAVDIVHRCTKKPKVGEDGSFIKQCVHIHPEWMEASDTKKLARWPLETGVKEPILIRGETIKVMCQLGMTKIAQTEGWLHFRDSKGFRLSLRKYALEEYPEFGSFLKIRGRHLKLPKGLADAAKLAGICAEDNDIRITLEPERMTVEGIGPDSNYKQTMKSSYVGQVMSFLVPHKLVIELVKDHSACEVTEQFLRVDGGGRYIFLTSLELQP